MKFYTTRLNAKADGDKQLKELRVVRESVYDAELLAILARAIGKPETITDEENLKLGKEFGLVCIHASNRFAASEQKVWGS